MATLQSADIDLSAGLVPKEPDLSAGLVPKASKSIDLSAGLVPKASQDIDLSAGLVPIHDPNDRLFTGGQGTLSVSPAPSVWDRIKSAVSGAGSFLQAAATGNGGGEAVPDAAMPALAAAKTYAVDPLNRMKDAGGDFGRNLGRDVVTGGTLLQHGGDYLNATVPSPYGPKPSVESPEKRAEREHPAAMGVAGGAGAIVGGTLADPRNWPFFASSAARPALQKLIARGFTTQMGVQTFQGAKELYDHWDRLTPEERWELGTKTGVSALMTAGGLKESVGNVEAPSHVQEVATRADSPLADLLHEPAQVPHVRLVDSSAAAHDLLERDTILRPVAEVPSKINDPALAAVEAQTKGRAVEVARKYPVTPVPADTEARTTGPTDIAALRRPSARVVSDDHVPVVSRDAVLADGVQRIIDNSDMLKQAGVDPATIKTRGDIDAALARASDHIKSNLDPRAEAVITLEGQKALASDSGMTVEDIIARHKGEAFNAEQLVAARAILKANSDAVIGHAMAAAGGDPESLEAFTKALSLHKALQEQIAGVRAESGRALGSFRIAEQDLPQAKIANILGKLPTDVQEEAARLVSHLDPKDPQAVRQLVEFAAKIKPSTTMDKLFEFYRNALLSSPHTLVVKTASEASMFAMESLKKAVASGISKDRYMAESWYWAKGMVQALGEHSRPILSGQFQLEGSPGFEKAGMQAIKGVTGKIVRAPSEAMSRATNLLYAGNYFGELQALAARQALSEGLTGDAFHARQEYLAHQPTEPMQKAAHELATTNTFQNKLTGPAATAEKLLSAKPTNVKWVPESMKSVAPGRWLAPFFKTPMALIKASLTHATPYELLNSLGDATKGRDFDVDQAARGLVGSSIAASLAALALSGHITGGGPVSYQKAETLKATGWQEYSIRIGDHYYSYKRFEPVGLVAGFIADTVHSMQHGDPEAVAQSKASQAVQMITRNFDNFPFMSTMANLFQAVHDPAGGRAQSFVNREAGSLVPAGVANVAETIDPTVRRPTSAFQAIQSRIPGLTSATPAIVDVSGKAVQRPTSNLGGANPFEWTTAKHDPVVDELARLGISTPQPPKQITWRGGQKAQLTDTEQQQFAQVEGQEFYRHVSQRIASRSWQRLSDDAKRKALVEIHRAIDEARPTRLNRMRRQSEEELARDRLRQSAP